MTVRTWIFRPLDTWFFRDGTPYNAGEGGVAGPEGNFPPSMNTVQGAIRTALAIGAGWTPEHKERWPMKELGGPDDLGTLQLRGPYILWEKRNSSSETGDRGGPGQEEVLYPAPYVLLKAEQSGEATKKKTSYVRLVPGEAVMCDLSDEPVRLPVPRRLSDDVQGGLELLEDFFLTKEGIEAVLAGGVPVTDDERDVELVVPNCKLWANEPRIGISLDRRTRTAEDGKLYTSVHTRLRPGVRFAVRVAGVPEEWHDRVPRIVRLGGEGRMAEIEVSSDRDLLPQKPQLSADRGKLRFTVTLITPGWFEKDTEQVLKQGPSEIPARCVSACIGKLQQVGGWDMVKFGPKPLMPVVPAGSTWFYEADADQLQDIGNLHGKSVGKRQEYGYGQVIIGRWEETQ